MGPGNMGHPGGEIVLFFGAGCVIPLLFFAATVIVLMVFRKQHPARKLIPVAVAGLVLCIPVAILSLYFLLYVQSFDGMVDYEFIAIWIMVSTVVCWIGAQYLFKLTGFAKRFFKDRNEDGS